MSDSSVRTSRADSLRLRLPCNLADVRPAALSVLGFLNDLGLSESELQACELALVEACNNAVHYAEGAARLEPIEIDVFCQPDQIELRITDHTGGFNWPAECHLPDPDQECGRGIFLIQSLMDEADYLRGTRANCLVLRKHRPRPEPGLALNPGFNEVNRKLVDSELIIREMAEELSFCYESLSAIFRCSAELGRTNDLEEFSLRLLTDLSQITTAEWFVLRLAEGDALEVFAASENSLDLERLPIEAAGASHSAELEAALTRQDIWFDPQRPIEPSDPLGRIQPGGVGLIHPIFLSDTLIGTLTVGRAAGPHHFTAVHANVVHTFADFLAIQIVNARFQEEQVASRVVSRELEIARNIQRSLLPKSLPAIPGYSLAGYCESARQVGGDFYDVLQLDQGNLLLIIADVMGKGIPAAMFASIFRSLLRAAPEWTREPARLLARLNRLLFEELSGVDMFITAQLIFIDTEAGTLTAAGAGHCPTIMASEEDQSFVTIAPEGLPLGIAPDASFSTQVIPLRNRNRLLLYTDGLTEARDTEGQFFGQERLHRWFQQSLGKRRTASELRDELAEELRQFQGNRPLHDDQTFLILSH